ncbi:PQQ-binding-like beta-propeller repeat protein [Nocardioides sp. dk4132]|nr:PQQ-binding-like beta-propeller repeat protein [Nocardioides sp. dk4132]QGA09124.1 PQQ-binding-like beta-propeller repeat protein [Nocardioides sp. dk884]
MMIRRHWKPLLAVAVVLLAALVYVGQDRWRHRCGAGVETLDAGDIGQVLQPGAAISGADPALLGALEALPAPFGSLVAGRAFEGSMSRPSVGAVDADTAYLASGSGLLDGEYDGQVVLTDVATGAARWGVGVREYGAGGGPVGDLFLTLGIPADRAPQLAAYDVGSGERVACTEIGEDAETGFDPALGSTSVAGGDVVVAREDPEGGLALSRLDPRSGEERWRRAVEHRGPQAVLDDAGPVVVSSAYGRSDLLGGANLQPGQVVGLTALDTESGEPAWTWPSAVPKSHAVQAEVVGTDTEAGRVYALVRTWSGEPSSARARVVAIDADGEEVWSRGLPGDHCDAALWGELVVTACGRPALAGLDVATGAPRWTTRRVLDHPHTIDVSGRPAVDLGDGTRLQPAADDLYRIDTTTGRATAVATEADLRTYVAGVETVGEHLVLSTASGVFVFEREE